MSEIMNGITNDRLNELFRHGHEAHPHEVAVMAGELIEHRKCKDCDGVHDGGCVNTSEAMAPVVKWLKWNNVTGNEDPPVPYRKIVNGSVVESIRKDGTVDANNKPRINEEFYISITEAEYLAATKPAAPVVEPWIMPHNDFMGSVKQLQLRNVVFVDRVEKYIREQREEMEQLQRRLEAVEKANAGTEARAPLSPPVTVGRPNGGGS
jgi:hypothetical protein